jgi:hypothetical protein
MISEVYDAFKEANVSDASARKASEVIAAYEARFANIDLKIEKIDGRLRWSRSSGQLPGRIS